MLAVKLPTGPACKLISLTGNAQARVDLERQTEAFRHEQQRMQAVIVADDDIVNLNVGGTLLSTRRSTLTQVGLVQHCNYSDTL